MEYDSFLIKYLGQFGLYQRFMFLFVSLEMVFIAFHSMSPVFLNAEVNHWCQTPVNIFSNCSQEQQMQFSIPREERDGNLEFSKCEMFEWNYTAVTQNDVCPARLGNNLTQEEVPSTVSCQAWNYDRSVFPRTTQTEWDLVCDKAGWVANIAGIYMAGRIAGSLLFGQATDSFGRRPIILFCGILNVVTGVACAFMPSYAAFLAMRFLLGCFGMGKNMAGFIQVVEFVGPDWRVVAGVGHMLYWALAYIMLAGIAYFIRDWRTLQLVITIPEILYYIVYFFVVPESPRWLLVKNKTEESKRVLIKAAKVNNVELPEDMELTVNVEKASGTVWDILRSPAIRWLSLNLIYNWFANSFVYYGLSLNTSNLGGDPFINFCISGAVEVPAYLGIIWVFNRYGRIIPFGISMLVGGIALLLTIPVPQDMTWLLITLSMIGKFFISATFVMAWLYTTEVYPTSIRSNGLGYCNLAARIPSVLAAYVGILGKIHFSLPPVIFGLMSITAGLLVFTMPETKGIPMYQTVEEGQRFIQTSSCKMCQGKKEEDQEETCETKERLTDGIAMENGPEKLTNAWA